MALLKCRIQSGNIIKHGIIQSRKMYPSWQAQSYTIFKKERKEKQEILIYVKNREV